MNPSTKAVFGFVGAVILGLLIYGAYQFPTVQVATVQSTAGSTFNSAKFAGIVADLSSPGSTGTSTSVLNTDSSDRYVTGLRAGCSAVGTSRTAYSGAGLAALTVSAATSSTASPATQSNTNAVGGGSVTIGTSTAQWAVSTSSATGSGSNAPYNVWAAGSYMTFTTNATNTAQCTFGVDYVQG